MQTADLRNDHKQVDFVNELFFNNNIDLNSPMLKKQQTPKGQTNSG